MPEHSNVYIITACMYRPLVFFDICALKKRWASLEPQGGFTTVSQFSLWFEGCWTQWEAEAGRTQKADNHPKPGLQTHATASKMKKGWEDGVGSYSAMKSSWFQVFLISNCFHFLRRTGKFFFFSVRSRHLWWVGQIQTLVSHANLNCIYSE